MAAARKLLGEQHVICKQLHVHLGEQKKFCNFNKYLIDIFNGKMSGTQMTLLFSVKKKSTFYGNKEDTPKQDFTNATLRSTPTTRYTPTVRKIVTVSSSSESSDSDSAAENTTKTKNSKNQCNKKRNVTETPRRNRKISKSSEGECTLNFHKL